MFSKDELKNKERSFVLSQKLFEKFDDAFNKKIRFLKDESPEDSLMLITIARFISYKEDIWKKNKKTKIISTEFSKDILDSFIFKGQFTSAKTNFLDYRKQINFNFNPPTITKILDGKETDSVWIIDNIRDSIAHGHYYIDYNRRIICIKNMHQDRILECSIDFETFKILTELITKERIGGYTDKRLTTYPILYSLLDPEKPISDITTESQLRKELKENFYVAYSKIINIREENIDKRYKDLTEFYNFNTRVRQSLFNTTHKKQFKKEFYSQSITGYCKAKLKNYDIQINNRELNNSEIENIIKFTKESPNFYEKNRYEQGMLLTEMLQVILSDEELDIEKGIYDITELYNLCCLKDVAHDQQDKEDLSNLLFCNINSFRETKKLGNLFILGVNNFVSNKEAIFDNYFDEYNQFDLHSFNYQDYSRYNKLVSTLKILNEDLKNANNSLTNLTLKLNKLETNLKHAPESKKGIIQNNIESLKNPIAALNKKISDLVAEITMIENTVNNCLADSNGKYICDSNKSFFNHLRNVFAHGHIRYADERIVYNRKIILEDFDDNGKLAFKCECRYYDLVKLFNNDLFLEAIKSDEKVLTKKN